MIEGGSTGSVDEGSQQGIVRMDQLVKDPDRVLFTGEWIRLGTMGLCGLAGFRLASEGSKAQ